MKLSMWSSYYFELSPEDTILELEKHGYRYCELSDEHSLVLMERGDPVQVGTAFGEFARAHNVELFQGHLLLRGQICKPEDRALIIQQLDLFLAIGIQRAVLHLDGLKDTPDAGVEELRSRNVEALRELTAHVAGTDLVICLENLRMLPVGRSAEDLLYFVKTVDSANMGICLDTGHLHLSQAQSQAEFIRAAGKHLKALHLADNDGSSDQHLIPYGRGTVDFVEVISEVKKLGYDGLYNFEVPGERRAPHAIKGYKLDYVKNLFTYLFETC